MTTWARRALAAIYGLLLLAVSLRAWQKFDGETAARVFAVGLGIAVVLAMAWLDVTGIFGRSSDD